MKNSCIAFIRASKIYDESRATKEILALEEAGYEVIVIGRDRWGDAMENCIETFAGKNISFYFYNKTIRGGIGLKGIIWLFGFLVYVYRILKAHKKHIDYVHACDIEAGLPGSLFCRINKKPLIYDIYDYFVDGHTVSHIVANMIEKLEIKVINQAETTIICTEERKVQISKASPKKLVVIHNSPDIDSVNTESCETEYDYVYCGVLGEMRLVDKIITVYPNYQHLKFLFAGNGELSEKVKNLSTKYEKITYVGSIPYRQVLEYESRAKVLSAIYDPKIRNHQLCAPNKFYEALALSKPIIVCRGTGIDKIVEKEQLGIVINYDAVEFFAAVEKLIADTALVKKMGMNAHKLYERKYHWKNMKERLIAIYDSLE